jgi:ribosomal protein S18 acetylase RimI-like enzyme
MFSKLELPYGLGLRKAQVTDQVFAEVLFLSARDYVYQMPIPKAQLDVLLKQQFQLQQASYTASFPLAETFIVEFYGQPIGKLMLNSTAETLHIIDIALLGDMRGKGYGTALLRALKKQAVEQCKPLRLAVDQQNLRAKKLYLGLGFSVIESSATHDTLLWK